MARRHANESAIRTTARILRRHVGSSWPIELIAAILATRSVVRGTRWASERSGEATFIRRQAAFAPALYLRLKKRLGPERALAAVREVVRTIGTREVQGYFASISDLPQDPIDRVAAAYDRARRDPNWSFMLRFAPGSPVQSPYQYRFSLTGCVFHEFFTAVGTPELTRIYCEIDEAGMPSLLPELGFRYDGTVGRGNPTCEFVFDRKAPPTARG